MLPLGDSSPNEAVVGLKPLIGVTPLLGNSRSFPGLMDVKSEKPTHASVASPAPDADADRHAVADRGPLRASSRPFKPTPRGSTASASGEGRKEYKAKKLKYNERTLC